MSWDVTWQSCKRTFQSFWDNNSWFKVNRQLLGLEVIIVRHCRLVTLVEPPNHVVNGDALRLPSGKNWLLQTQVDWCIDQFVSACCQDVSLHPFKDGAGLAKKRKWCSLKSFSVCVCVSSTYIGMQFSIKTSAVSISLEIYRILTAFSFLWIHL